MSVTDTIASVLSQKPRDICSIAPDASVYEALELMAERGIGALLVMTGRSLVGLISERDYARKIILQGKSSRETRVTDIMSSPVVTATLQDRVDGCMRLMTESRIRHLPVLVDGNVVGVISIGDLVRHTITVQEATIQHLNAYIASGYGA